MKYLTAPIVALMLCLPSCGLLEGIGTGQTPPPPVIGDEGMSPEAVVAALSEALTHSGIPENLAALEDAYAAADKGDDEGLRVALLEAGIPAWLVGAVMILLAFPRTRALILALLGQAAGMGKTVLAMGGPLHSGPLVKPKAGAGGASAG